MYMDATKHPSLSERIQMWMYYEFGAQESTEENMQGTSKEQKEK
jgi:hypothetical protein